MKRIFLTLILIYVTAYSQVKNVNVIIAVRTTALSSMDTVFISGSNTDFGNWQPDKIPLSKFSQNIWSRKFTFSIGDELEFKFTRGSWENEAVDSEGRVPSNHYMTVAGDTALTFAISNWKDEFDYDSIPKFEGQITGKVYYHKNLLGENILPRDIVVWVPPGYAPGGTRTYPVLYMQDGQNIFDPATSAYGIDWQIDETVTDLISKNEIEPCIVVGIYNTPARMSEYTPNETGRAYMNFVVNTLKPFIDKNYRTKSDRTNTAVGGSSGGGIISFMILWEYSDVFSKAICMSPAFKIDDIDYVHNVNSYWDEKKDIEIYIDNGGVGIEKKLQPGIDEMVTALLSKGYKLDDDLHVYYFKTAEHNETAWAARMRKPLILFFGKK